MTSSALRVPTLTSRRWPSFKPFSRASVGVTATQPGSASAAERSTEAPSQGTSMGVKKSTPITSR